MISCEDYTVCFSDSYPAGSFQGLCGFVDKEGAEMPSGENPVITADQCRCNDTGTGKEVFVD